MSTRSNWSGNVQFASTRCDAPASLPEVQAVVGGSAKVRAIGSAHSFNRLADTNGVHISVANLPRNVEIDSYARVASVPAGMRWGVLAQDLHTRGWGLSNLASLGHISAAGAVATATHGSGDTNPTLSADISGVEMITAGGDHVTLTRADNPEIFPGSVVALGALGVTTRLLVDIQPAFEIRQYVYDNISHESLLADFDGVFGSAYSVSFFTCWAADGLGQVWMKRREDKDPTWDQPEWMGGTLAPVKRHPLPGHDALHCTEQGGALGPAYDRLPHFALDFTPSSGDELQTEYLVPRDRAVELLAAVDRLAPRIRPLLYVSEIRTMAGDDCWLSGAYGRDTVGIHFTWQRKPEVADLLTELDDIFAPAGGRPHWGKMYQAGQTSISARYPRFNDFVNLVATMDPQGKFRNSTLDDLLGEN